MEETPLLPDLFPDEPEIKKSPGKKSAKTRAGDFFSLLEKPLEVKPRTSDLKTFTPKPVEPTLAPVLEKEKVFSVDEFLDVVITLLKPLDVMVQGEISSVQERGNAIYFSIADKKEKALLNCFMWRTSNGYLQDILREGTEVVVTGTPKIYKPFGKFSFDVKQITPVGEGALKQAFEALKKQLDEEGYFETTRKRKLPEYVSNIGLITSEFGDARKDFVTHLGTYGYRIYFHDVRVEGARAVDSVARAIEWFNIHAPQVEVLVVTRGGGSLESLQAFNSLEVAQAIFSSRIPVISAVGHENDVTIADLVADVRASTPTHAGKIVSQGWMLAEDRIRSIDTSLTTQFLHTVKDMGQQFEYLQQSCLQKYHQTVKEKHMQLTWYSNTIQSHFKTLFTRFNSVESSFFAHAQKLKFQISSSRLQITDMEKNLQVNTTMWLNNLSSQLNTIETHLTYADPAQKLKQGYSITYGKNGTVVKRGKDLSKGDSLKTQFADGYIESTVK